jgi:ribosomal protein S18 acetylase RimI-like enzyme
MKDALGHGSAAHQAGVDQVGGKYTTTNDVRDAHGGELYGSILAHEAATGNQVGHLDYGAYWNSGHREVGVQMIGVDPAHQRQGIASQMMDKLRNEFTERGVGPKVKWGMTTDAGTKFKRGYYGGKRL